jgi:hypothetical protein
VAPHLSRYCLRIGGTSATGAAIEPKTSKNLPTDRLARSVPHLCEIDARLEAKGVSLKVLDQAIDTSTPNGRLMFNLLGSIAQFERELTRERMLVGIAKARADGKYKGRAPTARAKADKVRELRNAGVRPAACSRVMPLCLIIRATRSPWLMSWPLDAPLVADVADVAVAAGGMG